MLRRHVNAGNPTTQNLRVASQKEFRTFSVQLIALTIDDRKQ